MLHIPSIYSNIPHNASYCRYQHIDLAVGTSYKCTVIHSEGPGKFYVHLCDKSVNDLEELMSEIQDKYTVSSPSLEECDVGRCCVALYGEDGKYYRARVQEQLADNRTRVLFIDYGNTEDVPCIYIKEILGEHKNVPQLSILCSLYDLHPMLESWSDEAVDFFDELTSNRELDMTVESVAESGRVFVSLADDEIVVAQSLVDEHHATMGCSIDSEANQTQSSLADETRDEDDFCSVTSTSTIEEHAFTPLALSADKEYYAHIVCVQAPDSISVTLTDEIYANTQEEIKTKIRENVGDGDSFVLNETFEEGKPCLAKLDETWHRALVLSTEGDVLEVRAVPKLNTKGGCVGCKGCSKIKYWRGGCVGCKGCSKIKYQGGCDGGEGCSKFKYRGDMLEVRTVPKLNTPGMGEVNIFFNPPTHQ